MFTLAEIKDRISVPPNLFNEDLAPVLLDIIEGTYANKILPYVGLVVCVYDLPHIGAGEVHPGEGAAHFKVTIRLVVFRPFVGEVLVGRVLECRSDGLKVTLGFFSDIHIPSTALFHESRFKLDADGQKYWQWLQDGSEEGHFVLYAGDLVKFRVRSVEFTEVEASAKGVQAHTTIEALSSVADVGSSEGLRLRRRSSSVDIPTEQDVSQQPMEITGVISDAGLGHISWW
mmetsp:Transcript_5673/g.19002  ORF Transcript_5673/g.19002 Transcript_5673/m.19002 type:complete len:230 (+) Transcript_5673:50-739(+)